MNIKSMSIEIREPPNLGNSKVARSHCHYPGHRNNITKPCELKKCTEYTCCGLKEKHPEYFSKLKWEIFHDGTIAILVLTRFTLFLMTLLNFVFGQSRLWKFVHGLVAVPVETLRLECSIHLYDCSTSWVNLNIPCVRSPDRPGLTGVRAWPKSHGQPGHRPRSDRVGQGIKNRGSRG